MMILTQTKTAAFARGFARTACFAGVGAMSIA